MLPESFIYKQEVVSRTDETVEPNQKPTLKERVTTAVDLLVNGQSDLPPDPNAGLIDDTSRAATGR